MKTLIPILFLSCFAAISLVGASDADNKTVVDIDSYGTTFRLSAVVPEINCTESSQFLLLTTVSWRIQICKRNVSSIEPDQQKTVLDVFLLSSFNYKDQSCKAKATFKLFPNDNKPNTATISKNLFLTEFSDAEPKHGIEGFLKVDFDDYIIDNKFIFEIDVSTNPMLVSTPKKEIDQFGTKLRVMLNNVNYLENVTSRQVNIQGVRWSILAKNENGSFTVYLKANEEDLDFSWSRDVQATFKLLSFDKHINSIFERSEGTINWGMTAHKLFTLSWEEFTDPTKKFAVNNSTVFLVSFQVKSPEPLWDVE